MVDGPSVWRRRGPLASAALLALVSQPAHSQNQPARTNVLEEIVVTATRIATNLQQTPMSIAAFTGEDLELSGIESGRELGIMVPNVVINPTAANEFNAKMIVRGLPGVTTYIDGRLRQLGVHSRARPGARA